MSVWWLIEIAFGDLASQFNVEPKKITNHFACRIIIFWPKNQATAWNFLAHKITFTPGPT